MSSFTPGPPTPPTSPGVALDLEEPRDLGGLIATTFRLWTSRAALFVVIATVLYVPADLIIVGVIGHGFGREYGAADIWPQAAWGLLSVFVVAPLVTATHARAVVSIAEGHQPTIGEALAAGFARFPLVAATAFVVFFASMLGFFALCVGLFVVATFTVFATQYSALEGRNPFAAMRASYHLVLANGFWVTLGYFLLINLIANLAGGAIGFVAGIVGALSGGDPVIGGVLFVLVSLVSAAAISFTALGITLMFFSWKARARLKGADVVPAPGAGGLPAPGDGAPSGPTFTT